MKKIIFNLVIFFLTINENSGKIKGRGRKPRVITKRILATLRWPNRIPDQLKKARHIEQGLTGNPKFPLPWASQYVTLVDFGSHIDDFENAIGAGDADLELSTGTIVHNNCRNLKPMVQAKMDSDIPNSETICIDAGFDVKREGQHQSRGNSVLPGNQPGSVVLTGVFPGPHEWRISANRVDITPLPSTTSGKTVATGLTSKTEIWQSNRCVLPKGQYTEWTPWVSGMVP